MVFSRRAFQRFFSIQAKIRAKKRGLKWGFPRFKSFERMKSIYFPQAGFSLGQKLSVTPFGEIPIIRHRAVKGAIKTLTLKREQSGKWHAIFRIVEEPKPPKLNTGPAVGLDFGLNHLAALSDGAFIENPRIFRKFENMLSHAQQRLSKKCKGSHNRKKAKLKVAQVHEALANARKDHLHKAANALLSSYSRIAIENLGISQMTPKGHGKGIHDAAWATFTHILCYKAASAGSEIVFVNPKDTSKECSRCHSIVSKSLRERTHSCSFCGLMLDRDVNAALNILNRATAGMAGSNACGDGIKVPSLNQAVADFDRQQSTTPA
ncbi:MAG: transposase [Candidatus Marsarchaeota archaeon]|nr:transposase [Candidatus Marsarchaeota archaeon]